MEAAFPPHTGFSFTKTYHTKAEGPTDPSNTKLPNPFVVLVTGAGKGLGYHISLAYARAGASGIIIASRTESDLDKLSREILTVNPRIKILSQVCDTMLDADLAQLAKDVETTFGRLDVAVANAGVISKYIPDGESHRLPRGLLEDDDYPRVIDVNLLGSWRLAKHFMSLLSATKDGPQTYILITSITSHSASSEHTPMAYNVSKFASNKFVESIHTDHHEKEGINAFALHPGAVLTPQTAGHTGNIWDQILTDDIGLAGGFCVWLSKQKREWLSGRYISANWDIGELEAKKDEIVKEDKLKFKMVV